MAVIYPYLIPILEECVFEPFEATTDIINNFSQIVYTAALEQENYEAIIYVLYYSLKYGFDIQKMNYSSAISKDSCLYKVLTLLYYEQRKDDKAIKALKNHAKSFADDEFDRNWIFIYEALSFEQLADEWLALQEVSKELKPSSLLRMKDCRERTYSAIGDTLVSKLSFRKVQAFISSLGKQGVNKKTGGALSVKTQKHYLTFVSDVILYAKRCGYINDNPCKDITFTKSQKKEKDIYSLDEAKELLAVIDEKAPTDYKLFFNLLAYSGMRRGEALGLEYHDIDFNNSVLTIKRTSNYRKGIGVYTDTPKTESSYRSLYIQPKIVELIKQLQAEQQIQANKCGDLWVQSDRLFVTWCGKPMHPNTPYTWLQRFCERENISFKGLHSFRHFVATQAIASGIDVKSVSAMLGHSQTSTTLNIYAHAVQQTNKTALTSVANLLETA